MEAPLRLPRHAPGENFHPPHETMSEIPKTYEPQAIEEKWYAFWQDQGCFAADRGFAEAGVFHRHPAAECHGRAHLGHVLNNTIQDILARRARMLGKEVLWLPGTDHAGIATQTWWSGR